MAQLTASIKPNEAYIVTLANGGTVALSVDRAAVVKAAVTPGDDVTLTVAPPTPLPVPPVVVTPVPVPVQPPPPVIVPAPAPVINVGVTPGPLIELPPGPQRYRKTVTIPGTRIVSRDPAHPAVIHGGLVYFAPGCSVENLVFDGEVSEFSWSIKLAEGGGCDGKNIEFRNVYNGLFCETTRALGGTFTDLRSGAGVKKYPVGLFGAKDVTLINPWLLDYRGAEHPIRVNGQGYVASKRIKVLGGEITRTGSKEPITVRHGEDVQIVGVKMKGGFGVRLCWEPGQPDVQSKNIAIRDCTMNCPIFVFASGVDGLLITGNKFVGLPSDVAMIHYNPSANRTANVTEIGNTRDTPGPMQSGRTANIPNYVVR